MATFNLVEGNRAAAAQGELARSYLAVVLGIVLHFVWEILVAAVQARSNPDFGGWGLLAARLAIAFIVGVVSFMGVWKQLEPITPGLRFFTAVTQGFAIDALASPLAPSP